MAKIMLIFCVITNYVMAEETVFKEINSQKTKIKDQIEKERTKSIDRDHLKFYAVEPIPLEVSNRPLMYGTLLKDSVLQYGSLNKKGIWKTSKISVVGEDNDSMIVKSLSYVDKAGYLYILVNEKANKKAIKPEEIFNFVKYRTLRKNFVKFNPKTEMYRPPTRYTEYLDKTPESQTSISAKAPIPTFASKSLEFNYRFGLLTPDYDNSWLESTGAKFMANSFDLNFLFWNYSNLRFGFQTSYESWRSQTLIETSSSSKVDFSQWAIMIGPSMTYALDQKNRLSLIYQNSISSEAAMSNSDFVNQIEANVQGLRFQLTHFMIPLDYEKTKDPDDNNLWFVSVEYAQWWIRPIATSTGVGADENIFTQNLIAFNLGYQWDI